MFLFKTAGAALFFVGAAMLPSASIAGPHSSSGNVCFAGHKFPLASISPDGVIVWHRPSHDYYYTVTRSGTDVSVAFTGHRGQRRDLAAHMC
jgi:hypothetical protein